MDIKRMLAISPFEDGPKVLCSCCVQETVALPNVVSMAAGVEKRQQWSRVDIRANHRSRILFSTP